MSLGHTLAFSIFYLRLH